MALSAAMSADIISRYYIVMGRLYLTWYMPFAFGKDSNEIFPHTLSSYLAHTSPIHKKLCLCAHQRVKKITCGKLWDQLSLAFPYHKEINSHSESFCTSMTLISDCDSSFIGPQHVPLCIITNSDLRKVTCEY